MWPFKKKAKDYQATQTDAYDNHADPVPVVVKPEAKDHPDCRHVWQDEGFTFCTVPDETIPQHCIICGDFRVTQRPRDDQFDFSGYTDTGRTHSYRDPVTSEIIDAMFGREIVTFVNDDGSPIWKATIDKDSSIRASKSP